MAEPSREFGTPVAGATYQFRPGGYAIVRRDDGKLAAVVTPVGVFLPGGGLEDGETLEEATVREVDEESGLRVRIVAAVGVADELVFVPDDDVYYRKRCTFFVAEVVGQGTASEADHELVWFTADEAAAKLSYASQRWALRQARGLTDIALVPIDHDGTPRSDVGVLPEEVTEVLQMTAALYERAGFEAPWICYLALSKSTLIGTCGFTSSPIDGRVEIAYYTFPDFEGRGHATAMASRLIAIAEQQPASVVVTAHTLPVRNASHRILEKLDFHHVATLEHPEDGVIWEWELAVDSTRR